MAIRRCLRIVKFDRFLLRHSLPISLGGKIVKINSSKMSAEFWSKRSLTYTTQRIKKRRCKPLRSISGKNKPDRLERAYKTAIDDLPRKPCPTFQGVASVLKIMAQYGLNPKAAQLKPDEIMDLSLCKKLEETGFIDRQYQW